MTLALRYAARSDVGLLREGNEDSAYAGPRLLAVADGMGGHAAGEVASGIAIATIAPLDSDLPGSDLLTELRKAAESANQHLREMVAADNELEGMGTTLTALLHDGSRLGLLHIGDSRAYLYRDGELVQITHDHTLVKNLVDEGRLSAEAAQTHPHRGVITRALDGQVELDPDLSVFEVQPGDRLLVCSDGLTGVVSDETIAHTLSGADPQQAVDRLVELALRGGGPDNVTVIVADVVDQSGVADRPIVTGAVGEEEVVPPDTSTPAARAALARPRRARAHAREGDLPRRFRRPVIVAAVAAVVILAGIGATWAYIRTQYYVGATRGQVAIFRGVPGRFAGISLSSVRSRPGIPVAALPQVDRDQVHDGISANGLGDAQRIVARLLADALARCHPPVPPTPTPRTSASPHPSPTPKPTPKPKPPPGCTGLLS